MKRIGVFSIVALCLASLAFGFQLSEQLGEILHKWSGGQNVMVYLESHSVAPENIEAVISKWEEIESVQIITPETSLSEFQAQMAALGTTSAIPNDLLDLIPATLLIKLKKDSLESALTLQKLKSLPGVESVDAGQSWIQSFNDVIQGFKVIATLIGVFIFAITSFVIFKSIQVYIYERKEHIEILELLGADAHYIRKPFLLEGLIIGGSASLAALLLSFVVFIFLQNRLIANPTLMSFALQLHSWSWHQINIIIFIGPCLGFLSAFLSVRTLNTGWSAARKS